MGSLREKMLEEEHERELCRMQSGTHHPVMSFTETISVGNRVITRTAAVTILASANMDEAMAFLKRSVRDESAASPTS